MSISKIFFEQILDLWPSVGYLAQWRITIRRRWLDDGRVCVVTRRSNFPKINLCRATHLTLLTRRRRRLAASEIKRRTMGQTAPKRPETPILEWISPILILMVLICPYGSPWVPLVPKSHYKLVEVFKFTRYVARNHMQFWSFSSFQWNHFHDLHVSSDVLDSSGHTGILWKTCKKSKF